MKRHVVISAVCAVALAFSLDGASAVADEQCGTVVRRADLAKVQTLIEGGLYDQPVAPPFAGPTLVDWVPLTIHVIRQGDGSGGATQNTIDVMIANCNGLWSVAAMQFFQAGPTRFIDDDELYNSALTLGDMADTETHVPDTINIYLVPGSSGCGSATFPWATFPPHDDFQGIIVRNTCAAGPALLAHEMGHYFSLYHTHMTVYGAECPDGSNGDVAGDMLIDTPADPNLSGRVDHQTCAYTGSVPPPDGCDPEVPYDPDPSNIMSYAPAHCQTYFSPQQIGVARDTLENIRPELIRTCPADLNGNGDVGFEDLTALLSAWESCTVCPQDLDGNGSVGFEDLTMLLSHWGPC